MSPRPALLALLFFALAAPASGAGFVVTKLDDTNDNDCSLVDCSLREAVHEAEDANDADVITFAVTGTHPIGAHLAITKPVTIRGNGSGPSGTVLDSGGAGRAIAISSFPEVTLETLRVTGGNVDSTSAQGGAGIRATGATLRLDGVVVTGNTVTGGDDGFGGAGLLLGGGAEGIVVASTIADNTIGAATNGANGAGIAVYGTSSLTLTGSTVSGNFAAVDGNGGAGGIYLDGTATITNSTIAGNQSGTGGGGGITFDAGDLTLLNATVANNTTAAGGNLGGGIYIGAINRTAMVKNSIVSGNLVAPATVSNCVITDPAPDPISTITDQGANVEAGTTCGFGTASAALAGTLGSFGGNGQSFRLFAGEAPVDRGGTDCPDTDQRGVTRPQGASCDSGAYELAPATATTLAATGVGQTTATLNATVANPDAVAGTTYFEYGTTTGYGSTTAAEVMPPYASAGDTGTAVTGLSAGTTYHYRAVTTNGVGAVHGADQTFTTSASTGGGGGGGGGGTTPPPSGGGGGGGTPPPSGGGGTTITTGKPTAVGNGVAVFVTTPGPGTLTGTLTPKSGARAAARKAIGRSTVKVNAAKRVRLVVKLNKAGRALLKRKGQVKATLKISFKPTSGAATATSLAVTIKRKKKG